MLPFITPDQIKLQNRENKSSFKNPSENNNINNLIPLLIQPTRDHYNQEPPPLLRNHWWFSPIVKAKIQAGLIPFIIRLLPQLSFFFSQIGSNPWAGRGVISLLDNLGRSSSLFSEKMEKREAWRRRGDGEEGETVEKTEHWVMMLMVVRIRMTETVEKARREREVVWRRRCFWDLGDFLGERRDEKGERESRWKIGDEFLVLLALPMASTWASSWVLCGQIKKI